MHCELLPVLGEEDISLYLACCECDLMSILSSNGTVFTQQIPNETETQSEMLVEILGSVSAQRPGGCGFDPRPSHTKDYKKTAWHSVFRVGLVGV